MPINELTYQGSKNRFMEVLKPLIENNLDEGMTYIEPFGGGMNSFMPIQTKTKIAGDNNEYVIALWNDLKENGLGKVLEGWSQYINVLSDCEDKPNGPNFLKAKSLYKDMKQDCLSNGGKYPKSLLGFVASSCSYGGGWWNGFVGFNPKRGENYIKNAIKGLKKQIETHGGLDNSIFVHGEYNAIDIPDNAFIYCDPPYSSTKQYAKSFNSESFWDWCRYLLKTKNNIKILISEYNAPEDFICIWESSAQDKMGTNNMSKREKLFIHNSQRANFNLSSLSETVKVSRADIHEMVRKCVNKLLNENDLDELNVFHGTEANFDKFDLSFIGTGEGTQVYGYGLYFTDVEDTGEWYVVEAIWSNKWDNVKCSKKLPMAVQHLKRFTRLLFKAHGWNKGNMSMEEIKERAYKALMDDASLKPAYDILMACNTVDELKNILTDLKKEAANGYNGYVYKVEVPDTGYIDWNETDKNLILNLYNKFSERFDVSHVNPKYCKTFGSLYEKLRGWTGPKPTGKGEIIPQKELSLYLKELGYNGIKVRTGNKSGGDGRGMNFVVFDDNDVKLIQKKFIEC